MRWLVLSCLQCGNRWPVRETERGTPGEIRPEECCPACPGIVKGARIGAEYDDGRDLDWSPETELALEQRALPPAPEPQPEPAPEPGPPVSETLRPQRFPCRLHPYARHDDGPCRCQPHRPPYV